MVGLLSSKYSNEFFDIESKVYCSGFNGVKPAAKTDVYGDIFKN